MIGQNMADKLRHRGPDACGIWEDAGASIVLAHTRLSILDLTAAGDQPIVSHCGRYVVAYNGEIYNHIEVRQELSGQFPGIRWVSKTDTETLIEAIARWGLKQTLKKIRGMFAFALWDRANRTLHLARDRMGEKPLYFARLKEGVLFSSELKALETHPQFCREINRDAVGYLCKYHYIPAPLSIYKNVEKMLPGHVATFNADGAIVENIPFWSVAEVIRTSDQLVSEERFDIRQIITDAVKEQLVADVPVGVFLSGGVDSTIIAKLAQENSSKSIKTFCAKFTEHNFDESKFAYEIAEYIGTDHTTLQINTDDVLSLVSRLSSIYCEPFADASQIPTYLISAAARQHVTVALSGDGGDELFLGYRRHRIAATFGPFLPSIPLWARSLLGRALNLANQYDESFANNLGRTPLFGSMSDRYAKLASVLDCRGSSDMMDRLISQGTVPGVYRGREQRVLGGWANLPVSKHFGEALAWMDMVTYLPDDVLVKVDRASMAVGLETRAPFLDFRVVERALQLPVEEKLLGGGQKLPLRRILDDLVPRTLTNRPKQGFSPPIATWLRTCLRDWAENLLSARSLQQADVFDSDLVRAIWKRHLLGDSDYQYVLWPILMFQSWTEARK